MQNFDAVTLVCRVPSQLHYSLRNGQRHFFAVWRLWYLPNSISQALRHLGVSPAHYRNRVGILHTLVVIVSSQSALFKIRNRHLCPEKLGKRKIYGFLKRKKHCTVRNTGPAPRRNVSWRAATWKARLGAATRRPQ